MCGEGLSRVMLGVWNEILVVLQHVRAIAHRRQVLDLLLKDLTCFDRPSSTGKAEDHAKDGSAGLAKVALDTPTGAIANRVRMSAVRTLHRSFSKSQSLLHLYKRCKCANPIFIILNNFY